MTIPTRISVFIPGRPAAQGSKRHIGGGRMIEASKNVTPWRNQVAWFMRQTMNNEHCELITTATTIHLDFILPRPVSTPKSRTPAAIKKPDLDKLIRAVFDAITGVAISDDSIVDKLTATKSIAQIGQSPGAHIAILFQRVERENTDDGRIA
jgi:crossover junction endodeoxyribonuclease RusA